MGDLFYIHNQSCLNLVILITNKMKTLFYALILCLLSCGKPSGSQSNLIASSIIGGREVSESDLSALSTVAIQDQEGKTFCTGTLVSYNLILTASHCFIEEDQLINLKNTRIAFTQVSLNSPANEYRKIIKVTVPPEAYNKRKRIYFDLALVKIDTEAPLHFKPVKILSPEHMFKAGDDLIIAGFGYTEFISPIGGAKEEASKTLNQVNASFSKYADQAFEGTLLKSNKQLKNNFLTYNSSGDGAYYCDSGGPAYLFTGKELILAGSVQGSINPLTNEDGVFMNLANFKNYILTEALKMKAITPQFFNP